MLLFLLILNILLVNTVNINLSSSRTAFINPWNPGLYRVKGQLYDTDDQFTEPINEAPLELDESQNFLEDDTSETPREALDLSFNSVTLYGRIGHISPPYIFNSGIKCLRVALSTQARGRDGTTKTDWHRILIYGTRNVDYIFSNAKVGDRAFAFGCLKYYVPNISADNLSMSRIKIAEISISSYRSGHRFILLQRPKNEPQLEDDRIGYSF